MEGELCKLVSEIQHPFLLPAITALSSPTSSKVQHDAHHSLNMVSGAKAAATRTRRRQ